MSGETGRNYPIAKRDRLRETLVVSEAIRKTMRGNRATDTKPELALRKELWRRRVRGYRLHMKSLPGSPDITYVKHGLAVFVHGCFWHGCPHCSSYREPKTNSLFWRSKLEENQLRDERAIEKLREIGFRSLVVWECQIESGVSKVVDLIISDLGRQMEL